MFRSLIMIICVVVSTSGYASERYAAPNGCEYLNVQVANNTGEKCKFEAQYNHGNLAQHSSVPLSIMDGDSKTFVMRQSSMFGPNITISARCGENKSVVFTAQQTLCFIMAWGVSGNVLAEQNMHAFPYYAEMRGTPAGVALNKTITMSSVRFPTCAIELLLLQVLAENPLLMLLLL